MNAAGADNLSHASPPRKHTEAAGRMEDAAEVASFEAILGYDPRALASSTKQNQQKPPSPILLPPPELSPIPASSLPWLDSEKPSAEKAGFTLVVEERDVLYEPKEAEYRLFDYGLLPPPPQPKNPAFFHARHEDTALAEESTPSVSSTPEYGLFDYGEIRAETTRAPWIDLGTTQEMPLFSVETAEPLPEKIIETNDFIWIRAAPTPERQLIGGLPWKDTAKTTPPSQDIPSEKAETGKPSPPAASTHKPKEGLFGLLSGLFSSSPSPATDISPQTSPEKTKPLLLPHEAAAKEPEETFGWEGESPLDLENTPESAIEPEYALFDYGELPAPPPPPVQRETFGWKDEELLDSENMPEPAAAPEYALFDYGELPAPPPPPVQRETFGWKDEELLDSENMPEPAAAPEYALFDYGELPAPPAPQEERALFLGRDEDFFLAEEKWQLAGITGPDYTAFDYETPSATALAPAAEEPALMAVPVTTVTLVENSLPPVSTPPTQHAPTPQPEEKEEASQGILGFLSGLFGSSLPTQLPSLPKSQPPSPVKNIPTPAAALEATPPPPAIFAINEDFTLTPDLLHPETPELEYALFDYGDLWVEETPTPAEPAVEPEDTFVAEKLLLTAEEKEIEPEEFLPELDGYAWTEGEDLPTDPSDHSAPPAATSSPKPDITEGTLDPQLSAELDAYMKTLGETPPSLLENLSPTQLAVDQLLPPLPEDPSLPTVEIEEKAQDEKVAEDTLSADAPTSEEEETAADKTADAAAEEASEETPEDAAAIKAAKEKGLWEQVEWMVPDISLPEEQAPKATQPLPPMTDHMAEFLRKTGAVEAATTHSIVTYHNTLPTIHTPLPPPMPEGEDCPGGCEEDEDSLTRSLIEKMRLLEVEKSMLRDRMLEHQTGTMADINDIENAALRMVMMKERVGHLQSETRTLLETLHTEQDANEQLREEVTQLQREVEDKGDLTEAIRILESQNDNFQQTINILESELDNMQEAHEKDMQYIGQLMEMLDTLSTKIDSEKTPPAASEDAAPPPAGSEHPAPAGINQPQEAIESGQQEADEIMKKAKQYLLKHKIATEAGLPLPAAVSNEE